MQKDKRGSINKLAVNFLTIANTGRLSGEYQEEIVCWPLANT